MPAVVSTYAACALCYGVLAVLLSLHSKLRTPVLMLVAACASTAAWSLGVALWIALSVGSRGLVGGLDVLPGPPGWA